jgi:PIN domain nuclease of toxin-antitoxin system
MRLLLDTCALLWFLRDDAALTAKAALAIEDASNEVLISVASIWEIAIKVSLGKLRAPDDFDGGLEGRLVEQGFVLLNVSYAHAAGVLSLPSVHRDPFDRLLISQCRVEKLIAVTDDPLWSDRRYGLKILW